MSEDLARLIAEASAAHEAGRFDDAVRAYGALVRLKPDFAAAHGNLGVVLKELGRTDEAVAAYRQAIAADPAFADAYYNLGVALHEQSRFDEAAAAYTAALAVCPTMAPAHANLGAVLHAQGRLGEAVGAYRAALLLQPGFPGVGPRLAACAGSFAGALASQGRLDEAVEVCRLAIAADPGGASHHYNLGILLARQDRLDEAVAAYGQAIALRPDLSAAQCNLGVALLGLGRPVEGEAACRRAVVLDPASPEAHNNLGMALREQGRVADAMAAYRQAIALSPDYADAHVNLAVAHLLRGEFDKGWAEYEWRWKCNQMPALGFTQPQWRGESLTGRTLLVHAEQGFGDTLHFARYVPLLAGCGGRVVFQVQRPLVSLMRGSIGADVVIAEGEPLPPFDVHCSLLSLPLVFRTTLDSIPARIPYLHADPAREAAWRQRLPPADDGLRVGLVWAGNPRPNDPATTKIDRRRSMRLADFAPLAGIPGLRLVSLQMDAAALQARTPPPGLDLVEVMEGVTDFADTAALLRQLDLVISVDTSMAHLAGGLGVPVWILSRFDGCWRWLEGRDDTPWYPTARLYRQRTPGGWAEVVERLVADLRERVRRGSSHS